MKVIQCNKCGKKIDEGTNHLEGTSQVAGSTIIVSIDFDKSSDMDLCVECATSVVIDAIDKRPRQA